MGGARERYDVSGVALQLFDAEEKANVFNPDSAH